MRNAIFKIMISNASYKGIALWVVAVGACTALNVQAVPPPSPQAAKQIDIAVGAKDLDFKSKKADSCEEAVEKVNKEPSQANQKRFMELCDSKYVAKAPQNETHEDDAAATGVDMGTTQSIPPASGGALLAPAPLTAAAPAAAAPAAAPAAAGFGGYSKEMQGSLFSSSVTPINNTYKETDLGSVKVLATRQVATDSKLFSSAVNPGATTNNFGGTAGVATQTVKVAAVQPTARALQPNSFVSPRTSTPQALQDYSIATTAKSFNGLVVNAKGEEGWYAHNVKTGQRDFIPVSALNKGIAIGQNPANGMGGFGDHRAAAGNLGNHSHAGTDFMNARGEAIYSNINGTVETIGEGGGNFGNRIWIRSDDGKLTQATAHMQGYNTDLKVGDKVTAGQYIGTVGNSGAPWSDPHLHIELRQSNGSNLGVAMDPRQVTANLYKDTNNLVSWMNDSSAGSFGKVGTSAPVAIASENVFLGVRAGGSGSVNPLAAMLGGGNSNPALALLGSGNNGVMQQFSQALMQGGGGGGGERAGNQQSYGGKREAYDRNSSGGAGAASDPVEKSIVKTETTVGLDETVKVTHFSDGSVVTEVKKTQVDEVASAMATLESRCGVSLSSGADAFMLKLAQCL